MAHILLIDDDEDFAHALGEVLRREAHQVRALDSAEEALDLLASGERFDLVLLDNRMPRMSGLEFLAAAGSRNLCVSVVLMTGEHDDRTAIQATNLGAFTYVLKTPAVRDMLPELAPVIDEVLKIARRPAPVQLAPDPAVEEVDEARLLGASRPMLKLLAEIGRLAQHDETVLILGETGTGKDLVARAIHTNSRRRNGPYLTMNCAALPETLLESELFGHEPGAFTSATKLRKGRFEHANGGTLFLDEVGDMPLSFQVKLLRVLENHEIVRVGGNDPIRIDVRILAATHRDLAALVREKAFREDLYYRLHVFPVRLPPLRERKGDIDLLGRVFLARMFPDRGARPVLHPDALRRLQDYDWPGNVRQLQKVLCRAAGSCRGRQIMPEDIDFGEIDRPESSNPQAALRTVVEAAWRDHPDHLWAHLEEQLQRQLLAYALEQPAASQSSIARRLGVSRGLVIKWLKQFGFNEPPDEADSASA